MNAVLTGSNGFSGRYLAAWIKAEVPGAFIIGIDLEHTNTNAAVDRYFTTAVYEEFTTSLRKLEGDTRFFHLAGLLGVVPLSSLLEANVVWTGKYLDAARHTPGLTCFINVGSSAEYGRQDAAVLAEDLSPRPVTGYGISKHLQAQLSLFYGKMNGLSVVSTRTFNLVGPGLGDHLVPGKMVSEFAAVADGVKSHVDLGRMDSVRDFIDIRDAVELYFRLSEPPVQPGIFNVAAGESHRIEELFETCCMLFGVRPPVHSRADSGAGEDIDGQQASVDKILARVPKRSFRGIEESMRDMIMYRRRASQKRTNL
jgi:nucleoside-diphosphate-sugar epimerase